MIFVKITKRVALVAFALMLLASAFGASEPCPKFVIIFTYDQGYEDLGCFGSEMIKTPHVDQMAADGLKLTSFYAQPVCGVSRASLMTGSYPIRIAEPGNVKRLHPVPHPKEITIAEVLKEAGYATALIGKWHLCEEPNKTKDYDLATMPNGQGFDFFYGTPLFNGFSVNVKDSRFRSPIFRNEEVEVKSVESWDHIIKDYTREAIQWVTENKDKPFFLLLSHNMPHIPLGASEDFKGKSAGGLYGDAVEEIDWSTGEVLKTLRELGLDENTLVIFTSDNGPSQKRGVPADHRGSADPLRGAKMSVWEGGPRVPCIVRWSGKVPAGKSSDELLTTMDLLPTFANLAGAILPPSLEIDGIDATDFLLGKEGLSPRDEFLYYAGCLLTGVRSDKWKLVLPRPANPPGVKGWWGGSIDKVAEIQLFNLDDDPGETSDVAEKHPEVVAELLKRIEAARAELGDIDQVGSGARFFDEGPRLLPTQAKKKSRTKPKSKRPE